MNGAGRRSKGATAERELAKLLAEQLGSDITRNLEQTRSGGHDLTGVGAFALEVKRQEKLNINAWWEQAREQAERSGMKPALAYRQSRKPWRFIVRLGDVSGTFVGQPFTVEMCIDGFCVLVRERLPARSLVKDRLKAATSVAPKISRREFMEAMAARHEDNKGRVIDINRRKGSNL